MGIALCFFTGTLRQWTKRPGRPSLTCLGGRPRGRLGNGRQLLSNRGGKGARNEPRCRLPPNIETWSYAAVPCIPYSTVGAAIEAKSIDWGKDKGQKGYGKSGYASISGSAGDPRKKSGRRSSWALVLLTKKPGMKGLALGSFVLLLKSAVWLACSWKVRNTKFTRGSQMLTRQAVCGLQQLVVTVSHNSTVPRTCNYWYDFLLEYLCAWLG